MSNAIYTAIRTATKGTAKVQTLIHAAYTSDSHGDIIAAAEAIETAFPVKKEDGKDANRAERNNLLSVLRVQLGRVGKGLEEPRKLTIKKVEGAWALIEGEAPAVEEEDAPAANEDGDGDGGNAQPEDKDEALWAAVELVSLNLSNKAVRIALADALSKAMAADKKRA